MLYGRLPRLAFGTQMTQIYFNEGALSVCCKGETGHDPESAGLPGCGDIKSEYFDSAQHKPLYPRNEDIEKRIIKPLVFSIYPYI